MRRDAIFSASFALALVPLSGCSVLFDPAQYSMPADADGLDARALIDAPDTGERDAFVEPGVDADLDAYVAHDSGTDAADPTDASIDALVAPDAGPPARPFCPASESTSLELPTCAASTRLAYCSPEGARDTVGFPIETAVAMVGVGLGGHRFGRLGNAIDLVTNPRAGTIVDHEISLDADTVTVTWAQNDGGPNVFRRRWLVGSPALSGTESYDLSAITPSRVLDVSTPSSSGEIAMTYVEMSNAAAARCTSAGVCTRQTMMNPPTVPSAWVASTSAGSATEGFAVAWPRMSLLEFETLGRPGLTGNGPLPMVEGLRPTHTALAYTHGPGDQFAIDLTNGFAIPVALGSDLPRITVADDPASGLVGKLTRPSSLEVRTHLMRCVEGEFCRCDTTFCNSPNPEATIPTSLPIVDWSFHNVGMYYRVAVILLGTDIDGTRVVVAMWSVADSPLMPPSAPPVIVASGRMAAPVGVGRSIRSAVSFDRASGRLDVFVATLVTIGAEDHIFLSGMRLLRCDES